MDFSSATAWAQSPGLLFRSLNTIAMQKVGDFNARQRSLGALGAQVEAIGLYAQQLQNEGMYSVYTERKMEFQDLQAQAKAMQSQISTALGGLLKIRGWIGSLPGGAALLGGPEALVVPATIITVAVAVIVVVNKLSAWNAMHDGSVTKTKQALDSIQKFLGSGTISKEQAAKLTQYVVDHGGLPDPSALRDFATSLGIGAIVIVLGIFLVMTHRKGAS